MIDLSVLHPCEPLTAEETTSVAAFLRRECNLAVSANTNPAWQAMDAHAGVSTHTLLDDEDNDYND